MAGMRRIQWILVLLVATAAVLWLGQWIRDAMGVEGSAESIRAFVAGFGWQAWAAYLMLITFRHFLLLPSTIMLTVGGILFDIGFAGFIGTLGLMCSGVLEFTLFRVARPQWMIEHLEERARGFTSFVERGAPTAIALSTAIPPTPMTAVYFAAAFTPISIAMFALCVALGAPVRAYALSLVGAGLVDPDNGYLLLGIGILVAISLVPLLYPPWRERLFPKA